MRKKIIVSLCLVLLSTGLFFLGKGLEAFLTPSEEVAILTVPLEEPASTEGEETLGVLQESPIKGENKALVHLQILDEVHKTRLRNLSVEFKSGVSVAEVTQSALAGQYRATGFGDSLYFTSILGISEKSAGAASGWVYYVNGQKPGSSAGSCLLKEGDELVWKFLENGLEE